MSLSKEIMRRFVDLRPVGWSLRSLEDQVVHPPDKLRILTYHQTPNEFESHVKYIASRFHPVSGNELAEALIHRKRLKPGALLVTFDDARCDFAERAWPILRAYDVPVVMFVPTEFPDHPERVFWWDRLETALEHGGRQSVDSPIGRFSLKTSLQRTRARNRLNSYCKSLDCDEVEPFVDELCSRFDMPTSVGANVLSWDELRRLANEGVEIASHTRSHAMLNRCSPERVRHELRGSIEDLQREIGYVSPLFAYPAGQFDRRVVNLVQEAGFLAGLTTVRGTNSISNSRRLLLRRINVGDESKDILRARLLQAELPFGSQSLDPESGSELAETLRNRVVFKGLDAVITATLPTAGDNTPSKSRYERVRSVARWVSGSAHGLARRATGGMLMPDCLPFHVRSFEPLAYGSGATVFRMETDSGVWALKVYRRALGRSLPALREIAAEMMANETRALDWYGPELIVPVTQIVLRGPLMKAPTVAGLQPFLDGKREDPYLDYDEDKLIALARQHPRLRVALVHLAERTARGRQEEGLCPDFVGRENLTIYHTDQGPRLLLLDSGFFPLATLEPEVRAKLDERIAWIERVSRALLSEYV